MGVPLRPRCAFVCWLWSVVVVNEVVAIIIVLRRRVMLEHEMDQWWVRTGEVAVVVEVKNHSEFE